MKSFSRGLWVSRSYDLHASILKALFLRMLKDEEIAETALQSFFIDLWRDQKALREDDDPLGLLVERARKQALMMPRNLRPNHGMNSEAQATWQVSDKRQNALRRLAPRQRLLVEGIFFDGKRIGDLAAEAGISREWVLSSLNRGLETLMRPCDSASARRRNDIGPQAV